MPSPIAHTVSGYALVKGLAPATSKQRWQLALYAAFVAISADFDFIPQVITGIRTHRGFTHSLGFAIAFSVVISALAIRRKTFQCFNYLRLWSLTLLIYGSHLILDFFTRGNVGVPLLWPVSDTMFQSAVPIFPAVHHSLGLFAPIHIVFISFELTYSAIVLWGLPQWNSYQQRRKASLSSMETMADVKDKVIRS